MLRNVSFISVRRKKARHVCGRNFSSAWASAVGSARSFTCQAFLLGSSDPSLSLASSQPPSIRLVPRKVFLEEDPPERANDKLWYRVA